MRARSGLAGSGYPVVVDTPQKNKSDTRCPITSFMGHERGSISASIPTTCAWLPGPADAGHLRLACLLALKITSPSSISSTSEIRSSVSRVGFRSSRSTKLMVARAKPARAAICVIEIFWRSLSALSALTTSEAVCLGYCDFSTIPSLE